MPILFGSYGALGGVLGALLLGEVFWLVLLLLRVYQPLVFALPRAADRVSGQPRRIAGDVQRKRLRGAFTDRALAQPAEFVIDAAYHRRKDEQALRSICDGLPGGQSFMR